MKKALVLGGGSFLGAYEAGVTDRIMELDPNRHYDIYTGISVGAINAGFLAQAKRGELFSFAKKLNDLWFGIKNEKDIYRKTIWGVLRLLWDTGVFDPEPLRRLINENFDPQKVRDAGNILRFGCVDLLKGNYVESTENSQNQKEWMMASASLPFAYPSPHIGEGIYTDGGMRSPTAISAAIKAGCEKIDIVLTSPLQFEVRVAELTADQMKNGLDLGLRLLTIMHDQTFIDGLKMLQDRNELADLGHPRYKKMEVMVYAPSKVLNSDMILTQVKPEWIREWWEAGRDTHPVPLADYVDTIGSIQEV